jgi:protein-S-isoprenylcysteine O-methyltransferase Ste14
VPELLDALGVRGHRRRVAVAGAIWVGFSVAMVGLAAGQAVVERAVGATEFVVCAVVVAVWLGWTYWHSVAFGRHRRRYLASGTPYPYRRAFLIDIFPGITIGFSQMLRSAWNGVNLAAGEVFPRRPETGWQRISFAAGVLLFACALCVFATAWRSLGAARVGFVREFDDRSRYVAERRGPYGHIRHPLFWSGVATSWSLALITWTPVGFLVAAVNTLYGLVYNVLEDRRMAESVGEGYTRYAREVPRLIPKAMRRASAFELRTGLTDRSGPATSGSRGGYRPPGAQPEVSSQRHKE